MKPKKYIYNAALGIVAAASLTTVTGCSEDFLDPDPLSMFAPENTYNTESGLQSTLAMCDRHLRLYYTHYDGGKCNISVPIMTEYLFSELGLYGKTDAGGGLWDDIAYKLSPTIHYLYLVEPCFINYSYISAICRCFYLIGILTKFHGFRNYWYYLVLYFRIYFVPLYQ